MKKFIKKKLYGGKLNEERNPKPNRIKIINDFFFKIIANLKIKLFKY